MKTKEIARIVIEKGTVEVTGLYEQDKAIYLDVHMQGEPADLIDPAFGKQMGNKVTFAMDYLRNEGFIDSTIEYLIRTRVVFHSHSQL